MGLQRVGHKHRTVPTAPVLSHTQASRAQGLQFLHSEVVSYCISSFDLPYLMITDTDLFIC